MDIKEIKKNIYNGMEFKKVKGTSVILKVMDDGFKYKIGQNGNSKKVSFIEMEEALKEIRISGYINRSWYEKTFPKIAKSNPCNFTSIGGVLESFGLVEYINTKYVSISKKEK